jgi:hypothetical protein
MVATSRCLGRSGGGWDDSGRHMLGGYAAAIPVVDANPGLLDAMYRSHLILFYVATRPYSQGLVPRIQRRQPLRR